MMLYLLKINISMLGLKKIQNNYQEYNINLGGLISTQIILIKKGETNYGFKSR